MACGCSSSGCPAWRPGATRACSHAASGSSTCASTSCAAPSAAAASTTRSCWAYHPGYGAGVDLLPRKLLVYDCVDEYAAFPELAGAERWIRERERRLCALADVVFCTSTTLHEQKRLLAPDRTHLVMGAGDPEHFVRATEPATPVPAEVASLPHPVVGFVGALSGYKVDIAWLAHLARARPSWSVLVIGPVGTADPATDVGPLRALPNVHLVGYRPYAELPALLKGVDVAVIPYRSNAYTRGVLPIKLFQLFASGRPVVTSDLPALAPFRDLVRVARDPDGFVAACQAALDDEPAARARRLAVARAHGWQQRAEGLMERVEAALARRQGAGRAAT